MDVLQIDVFYCRCSSISRRGGTAQVTTEIFLALSQELASICHKRHQVSFRIAEDFVPQVMPLGL